MPLLPRDLAMPYASLAEKEADWQRLLDSAETLRELAALADVPPDQWPDTEAVRRLRAAPPIANETTDQRLQRWSSVFEAELSVLQQAMSSVVRGTGLAALTDIDLRSAVYLASRLLTALYGVSAEPVRK